MMRPQHTWREFAVAVGYEADRIRERDRDIPGFSCIEAPNKATLIQARHPRCQSSQRGSHAYSNPTLPQDRDGYALELARPERHHRSPGCSSWNAVDVNHAFLMTGTTANHHADVCDTTTKSIIRA